MPHSRLFWPAILASGLALCASAQVWAQAPEADESPWRQGDGSRFRDNRDRGMSESARRFGREHQGAIILGIEPVLIHGRNLNRIKSLDPHGRVVIWIDDPLQPRAPLRRADQDEDGW